jgi:allophanate hydrolase
MDTRAVRGVDDLTARIKDSVHDDIRNQRIRGAMVLTLTDSLDIERLRARYCAGDLRPGDVATGVLERIGTYGNRNVWIHLLPPHEVLARARELEGRDPRDLPLYGIPFAIKDNIDLAGRPTTAACAEFSYLPERNAAVVQTLLDAGAIPIGKTNLDQFATGLVGTRSPYGACQNAFNSAYISGGSSSGSAVAVAAGLVSFSLGTDTAGSGRVPAAFNNLIGFKPTRGLLSNRGVVPACRSLDCVSIFSLTVPDALAVLAVAEGFDALDPFSRRAPGGVAGPLLEKGARFRFGVPQAAQLEFFDNPEGAQLFAQAVRRLQSLGGSRVEIDFRPFLDAGRLLYEGPWVAERYAAIREFIERRSEALLPITRQVIGGSAKVIAADAYAGYYRLKELKRTCAEVWGEIDVLVTPTAGTIYTLAQVESEPLRFNSNLGYYTSYVNLLDLSAVAVPTGFYNNGLPFGVTLLRPAFGDRAIGELAAALHRKLRAPLGATAHRQASANDESVREPVSHVVASSDLGAALQRQVSSADEPMSGPASDLVAPSDLGAAAHRQRTTPEATRSDAPSLRTTVESERELQTSGSVRVAVCGAHMSGLPLNYQLTERGASFIRSCRTAPRYRLFALDGFTPPRPGLLRMEPGHGIELEVWEMPAQHFGGFVDAIPAPLGIGSVELDDGEQVRGFLCEAYAIAAARDISHLGSWRAYLAQ